MIYLLQTFSILFRSCNGPFLSERDISAKFPNPPTLIGKGGEEFVMTDRDCRSLLDKNFLGRMLRENVDLVSIKEIAMHACYEDRKSTKLWVMVFKESFTGLSTDSYKTWFKLLNSLLEVRDTLVNWRLDLSLMTCLQLVESHQRKKELTDAIMGYLMRLSDVNELAKVWLLRHKEPLNKVLSSAGYRVG